MTGARRTARGRAGPPPRDVLAGHCRAAAARVLGWTPERIDTGAPLASLGFDSLLSLELRKRLESSLHVSSPTITWRFPTIDALVPSSPNAWRSPGRPAGDRPEDAGEPPSDDTGADLDDISDGTRSAAAGQDRQIDEGLEG